MKITPGCPNKHLVPFFIATMKDTFCQPPHVVFINTKVK
jgi:hypothetical protein